MIRQSQHPKNRNACKWVECAHILYTLGAYMALLGKVFKNGNSQAIRIPREYQLDCKEVWISRDSNGQLVIKPRPDVPKGYNNIVAYLLANGPKTTLTDEEREMLFARIDDGRPMGEIFL